MCERRALDVLEDGLEAVEFADLVNVADDGLFARIGIARDKRLAAAPALLLDQIELEFEGNDRLEAQRTEALQTRRRTLRGSTKLGLPVFGQGHQHLRPQRIRPQRGGERLGEREGVTVRVAILEATTQRIRHRTGDVEEIDGERNLHPALEDLAHVGDGIALAAHPAAQVDEQSVEVGRLRMDAQKGIGLLRPRNGGEGKRLVGAKDRRVHGGTKTSSRGRMASYHPLPAQTKVRLRPCNPAHANRPFGQGAGQKRPDEARTQRLVQPRGEAPTLVRSTLPCGGLLLGGEHSVVVRIEPIKPRQRPVDPFLFADGAVAVRI